MGAVRSAGLSAFSITCGLAQLRAMSSGPGARAGSIEPAGGFWTARVLKRGKVYPARPSNSETRHCMPRRYIYVPAMSGLAALSS